MRPPLLDSKPRTLRPPATSRMVTFQPGIASEPHVLRTLAAAQQLFVFTHPAVFLLGPLRPPPPLVLLPPAVDSTPAIQGLLRRPRILFLLFVQFVFINNTKTPQGGFGFTAPPPQQALQRRQMTLGQN